MYEYLAILNKNKTNTFQQDKPHKKFTKLKVINHNIDLTLKSGKLYCEYDFGWYYFKVKVKP